MRSLYIISALVFQVICSLAAPGPPIAMNQWENPDKENPDTENPDIKVSDKSPTWWVEILPTEKGQLTYADVITYAERCYNWYAIHCSISLASS